MKKKFVIDFAIEYVAQRDNDESEGRPFLLTAEIPEPITALLDFFLNKSTDNLMQAHDVFGHNYERYPIKRPMMSLMDNLLNQEQKLQMMLLADVERNSSRINWYFANPNAAMSFAEQFSTLIKDAAETMSKMTAKYYCHVTFNEEETESVEVDDA